MKINDDTKLTQMGMMFSDGEDKYFCQEYGLLADGEQTGVTIVIQGNVGKKNTTRAFHVAEKSFDNLKEALKFAGHEVVTKETQ